MPALQVININDLTKSKKLWMAYHFKLFQLCLNISEARIFKYLVIDWQQPAWKHFEKWRASDNEIQGFGISSEISLFSPSKKKEYTNEELRLVNIYIP